MSLPGLTRQSILKKPFLKIDGYAGKPAYEKYCGATGYSAACCATVGAVPATVARRMSRGCDWS